MRSSFQALIPWDEWFSQETNIRNALIDAGLTNVSISRNEYLVTMSATEYVSLKQATVEGTLLRRRLGTTVWDTFRLRLAETFKHRFGDRVTYERDAYLAVGTKAAALEGQPASRDRTI